MNEVLRVLIGQHIPGVPTRDLPRRIPKRQVKPCVFPLLRHKDRRQAQRPMEKAFTLCDAVDDRHRGEAFFQVLAALHPIGAVTFFCLDVGDFLRSKEIRLLRLFKEFRLRTGRNGQSGRRGADGRGETAQNRRNLAEILLACRQFVDVV